MHLACTCWACMAHWACALGVHWHRGGVEAPARQAVGAHRRVGRARDGARRAGGARDARRGVGGAGGAIVRAGGARRVRLPHGGGGDGRAVAADWAPRAFGGPEALGERAGGARGTAVLLPGGRSRGEVGAVVVGAGRARQARRRRRADDGERQQVRPDRARERDHRGLSAVVAGRADAAAAAGWEEGACHCEASAPPSRGRGGRIGRSREVRGGGGRNHLHDGLVRSFWLPKRPAGHAFGHPLTLSGGCACFPKQARRVGGAHDA